VSLIAAIHFVNKHKAWSIGHRERETEDYCEFRISDFEFIMYDSI
jgi:hypothetical protein